MLTISVDEKNQPIVSKFDWVRNYLPQSVLERKKLKENDSKCVAKYTFNLNRIHDEENEIDRLLLRYDDLLKVKLIDEE